MASLSSFTSLEVDENLTLLPIPHASICGVGLRHLPEESSFFASIGKPFPAGVHPHLDRAPRGARQGVLHAGRAFPSEAFCKQCIPLWLLDAEGSYPEAPCLTTPTRTCPPRWSRSSRVILAWWTRWCGASKGNWPQQAEEGSPAMSKKKVFVSFDYENDRAYYYLMKAWDAIQNLTSCSATILHVKFSPIAFLW